MTFMLRLILYVLLAEYTAGGKKHRIIIQLFNVDPADVNMCFMCLQRLFGL